MGRAKLRLQLIRGYILFKAHNRYFLLGVFSMSIAHNNFAGKDDAQNDDILECGFSEHCSTFFHLFIPGPCTHGLEMKKKGILKLLPTVCMQPLNLTCFSLG